MSVEIEIRRIRPDEAESYRTLRLESLKVEPQAFGSDYAESASRSIGNIAHLVTDAPDKFMLGAYAGDRMIGLVSLSRQSGIKARHKASVNQMYVSGEFRGNHIGRKLMVSLIDRARNLEGLESILLSVTQTNSEALSLYESLGFKKYGLERKALKVAGIYLDEALMELTL